jgi:hypothetical protein
MLFKENGDKPELVWVEANDWNVSEKVMPLLFDRP